MKTQSFSYAVLFGLLFTMAFMPHSARATYHAFLKIDGVEGNVAAPGRDDQIEVMSFSWGSRAPLTGGGSATVSDVTISKPIDKATPVLHRHSFTGDPVDSEGHPVVFEMVKTYTDQGADPLSVIVMRIELEGVRVESVRASIRHTTDCNDANSDIRPGLSERHDELTLSFTKITIIYSDKSPNTGVYTGVDADNAISAIIEHPSTRE